MERLLSSFRFSGAWLLVVDAVVLCPPQLKRMSKILSPFIAIYTCQGKRHDIIVHYCV